MSTVKVVRLQEQAIPLPTLPVQPVVIPVKHIVLLARDLLLGLGVARIQLDVDLTVGRVDVKVTDVDGNTLAIGVSHERGSILVSTPTGMRHDYVTGIGETGALALLAMALPGMMMMETLQATTGRARRSLRLKDIFQVQKPEDIVDAIKAVIAPLTR